MRAIDNYFINIAEEEAWNGTCRYKLGAVLAKRKEILSTGYNRWFGLDQKLTRYGLLWSLHAEMEAIRKARLDDLSGTTLYVARKRFRMAKPCDQCMKIITSANIARVVFTESYNNIKEIVL